MTATADVWSVFKAGCAAFQRRRNDEKPPAEKYVKGLRSVGRLPKWPTGADCKYGLQSVTCEESCGLIGT